MTLRTIASTVVAALALAGCQDPTDAQLKRSGDQVRICYARMVQSPEFQRLKAHFPAPNTVPSDALFADRQKPTDNEAETLWAFHRDRFVPCRQLSLDGLAGLPDAYANVLMRGYAETDAAYARLMMRQSTWGEFARDAWQVGERNRVRWDEAEREIERLKAAGTPAPTGDPKSWRASYLDCWKAGVTLACRGE